MTNKASSPPSLASSQRQHIVGNSTPLPHDSSPIPSTPASTEPPSAAPDVYHVPSYSRWFSWDEIHQCEVRFLPEFFDLTSPSKNPRVYKYYRNTIIQRFRQNPGRKITFTDTRKAIIGDVGSVRRVFDFLDAWGLINYGPPSSTNKSHLKWEDRSNAAAASSQTGDAAINSADFSAPKNRWCDGCKTVCTIACFYCDKFDLTLCARCYVRGNYRLGVTSSDFRRVEISEEVKAEWSEKETLHLLEAIMHFGDDWKKVAEHVGGRSERECVDRFIKLPFGDQFVNQPDHCAAAADDDDTAATESLLQATAFLSPAKRMRFTPLADASNPIMAQAAFLSALVGVDVAEAAARAAVRALDASDGDCEAEPNGNTDQAEAVGKEVQDLETRISGIAEVQMKEMKEKIVSLEEAELQMERKLEQLHQMKNMLFIDQLTLLFHKAAASKTAHMEDSIKFE